MGRINQNIDDDLERRFKEAARKKFGDKKGALKFAFEEAVRDWLKQFPEIEGSSSSGGKTC